MEAPTTTGRITQRHRHATEQIRRELEYRLTYFAEHPDRIDDRLAELDSEWDIERSLMANASTLALVGTALALLGRRRYLLLSVLVSAFLLQHAVQGWCPPLPLLRRLGVRAQYEIELERYALKVLRGDFDKAKDERKKPEATLDLLGGRSAAHEERGAGKARRS
ncbi:YgaP-like transmembrane domain [Alkalilimnicola ehrlichii]|uniref:DUF2892 domain-containing protein n=1 Tax=Alkalilimnicola ehrlichii TaxID=351052 RepID=A0A3E0X4E4_9GAMM|nr:YgaP-like transmembrane domain [Alkalilimnicola ehrlichii]RFA39614.1 hypothetical protein CAL65_02380 [Alkalilimnicola ehrlichii]